MANEALETNDTEEPVETPTTINIPEAEPANDNTSVDEPAPDGPQRATRAERKEMRFRHLQEARTRAEAAERQLANEAEERRKMATELAELRGRQQAYEAATRRQQSDADPAQSRIAEAHDRAWKKLQAAAASQDPARSAEAMKEYHEALTQASEVAAERRMQAQLEEFRRSQPDPNAMRMRSALEAEFEWLATNAPARALADGYVSFLTTQKGRPWGLATYREACAMAAKEFGLGGAAGAPSAARKAAYQGVSGRASADDDGESRNQIQASPEDARRFKIMAAKRFPELTEEQAYKKWLGEVGPRLTKK